MDRKAFIDILNQGDALLGGTMQPPPDGVWGLPRRSSQSVPGYGRTSPRTASRRAS
jgi:peptide/nickel transport system substrate-binding protein